MEQNWTPDQVLAEIKEATEAMVMASANYSDRRHVADSHKRLVLIPAQEAVDEAKSISAMDGMVSGATAGKNQAERDMKLDKVLREDKAYQCALRELANYIAEQARMDSVAESAEQEYKALVHKLGALKSASALMVAKIEQQMQSEQWQRNDEMRVRLADRAKQMAEKAA